MITDNPDKSRFEAHVDGELAGFLEYRKVGTSTVLVHTESLMEGQGIGSKLAAYALTHAENVHVVCPFIKKYLEKHPEHRVTVE